MVGFYKRGSGKPSISWPELVDEALCFGWIDGVRKGIDDASYTIRLTPRTSRSRRTAIWWVISAKREETRRKRLATLIGDSQQGRTIGPLRRRPSS